MARAPRDAAVRLLRPQRSHTPSPHAENKALMYAKRLYICIYIHIYMHILIYIYTILIMYMCIYNSDTHIYIYMQNVNLLFMMNTHGRIDLNSVTT